eukprot:2444894-Amphidinium_carterae.1
MWMQTPVHEEGLSQQPSTHFQVPWQRHTSWKGQPMAWDGARTAWFYKFKADLFLYQLSRRLCVILPTDCHQTCLTKLSSQVHVFLVLRPRIEHDRVLCELQQKERGPTLQISR